jgi:hypothetical protein
MTTAELDIARTGDALQRAWRADLRPRRRRPRVAVVAVAVLVVGAGVAAGASLLKSPAEEQASILAGTTLFHGSDPTCVRQSDVEYRCTLPSTPLGETFYDETGRQVVNVFLGMKVDTVDASHHVDGGCVSLSADGTVWDCYLGQAAVDHGLTRDLYGYSPEPAAG